MYSPSASVGSQLEIAEWPIEQCALRADSPINPYYYFDDSQVVLKASQITWLLAY
jgi:hypothetical protein